MNQPDPRFIATDASAALEERLAGIHDGRREEIASIADRFGDPLTLAKHYVEPDCQPDKPSAPRLADGAGTGPRTPLSHVIDAYLGRQARQPLFILAEAGMGKTSALVMLKLAQLAGFWPQGQGCLLLKAGADTLEDLRARTDKAQTVLLLDGLDEDPAARGRAEERIAELLQAAEGFGHVLIACRPRSFPADAAPPAGEPGQAKIGGFDCAVRYLSAFDDNQVDAYLRKRFPDPSRGGRVLGQNPLRPRAKALLDTMGALKFRPLLLSQADWLMRADTRPWNAYTAHEAWLEAWLAKVRRTIIPAPSLEEFWEACSALAHRMRALERHELAAAEFKALAADHPGLAAAEGFGSGRRSPLVRTESGGCRFAHHSLQEFLLARALPHSAATHAQTGDATPARPPQAIQVTDLVLEFLLTRAKDDGAPRDLMDLSGMQADALAGLGFRDRLKDGSLGPAMVMIPGGRFAMGAQPGKAADPSQEVCLEPFALGRYAVSFSEYDAFAGATGHKQPDDAGWGRGTRPVINVSWHDAQAYAAWLSEQTGKRYRLPSEAEWEYACRAGTTTHFYWGDSISPQLANYDSRFFYKGEAEERFRSKTLPVDAFAPNAFGLWQMHGNIWEWCEDALHEHHPEAPADSNGWSAPRVLRGGSWRDDAQTMRSAYRAWHYPHAWVDFGGFRLARTLEF